MIKVLKLSCGDILISKIEEVGSELGEPDCKLVDPFLIKIISESNIVLEPWMSDYSSDKFFMIHSDKIVTLCDPKKVILEKYQTILK
jgi:hypothetical protein